MSGKVLVLGGARSGKSTYAQQIAERCPGPLTYVATAQAYDREMADRIARHRAERDGRWWTVEAPLELASAISTVRRSDGALVVDCLTLWLSNLILAECDLPSARRNLIAAVVACPCSLVLVSNEVGMGIVPDNALARRFRDEAGWLHQEVAAACDEAVLIVAGLPLFLKRTGSNTQTPG